MTDDGRVFPLIEVSRDELALLVQAPIAAAARVEGGFTNTLHKVTLESGEVLVVKHFAGGAEHFEAELVTLTLLHGSLPVPTVVHAHPERNVIVYRWIDGVTFNELRRSEPAAVPSLAEPIGRLLAWLARTDATESYELAPILDRAYRQLVDGRARERLGAPLADALRKALEAAEPALAWGALCLVHGDLGGRNLIVQRADGERWRISGVIDWESTSTGSPLHDIGSLFRYAKRYDPAFRAAFERGYREADGTLPDGWFATARILDATHVIDMLDDVRERPGVYQELKLVLTSLAKDLA